MNCIWQRYKRFPKLLRQLNNGASVQYALLYDTCRVAQRFSLIRYFILISILSFLSGAHGQSAQSSSTLIPNVSLISEVTKVPITNTSQPYLGEAEKLADAGYVEEEYFISGKANVYEWEGVEGHEVMVAAGPSNYVNRILVHRPADPSRFSGNVEVLILNASAGRDLGAPTDFERMVERGDVWIGITSKAVAVSALKEFDPERYAPLDWSSPVEPDKRCKNPSIIPKYMMGEGWFMGLVDLLGLAQSSFPETEDGLIWDMLAQLGTLLKSDERDQILPGFSEPTLFMTGLSQSSIYIRTWLAAFHPGVRTSSGDALYDGYLSVIGPSMVRINQCSTDTKMQDPRQMLEPPEVPVISLYTEGEMWQGMYTRRPDVFTESGGMVTYEVAGASHMSGGLPEPTSSKKNDESEGDLAEGSSMMGWLMKWSRGGNPPNDFIWSPILRGAYHNLQLWVNEGIKPPQSPPIEVNENYEIVRDEHGNAIGGVRMPYIEVPTAAHRGYLSAGGIGGITGTKDPFSDELLGELYPSKDVYLERFNKSVDHLLVDRWILTSDAEAMKAAAKNYGAAFDSD